MILKWFWVGCWIWPSCFSTRVHHVVWRYFTYRNGTQNLVNYDFIVMLQSNHVIATVCFLFLDVHLGKESDGRIEVCCLGEVYRLLADHGGLHDCVVGLEGFDIVLVARKDRLFDALTEAVLANGGDDLRAVVLLGVGPSDYLVHRLEVLDLEQFLCLGHRLRDRRDVFLDFSDHGGIVKDPAGDLAVPPPQSQDQVEGRFLLDVVIGKGTTVLELLSGKNEALLIRGDSLLVLDLGLDVVDRVRGLDVEGDGLAGEGFYENLHSGIR
mmetsp:Transcript_1222/g.2770  ORF Transcript_1222/g.2770 Transcript_1222/m.2770 type:complete len:268 (-) Transcript_1222:119-922(-)